MLVVILIIGFIIYEIIGLFLRDFVDVGPLWNPRTDMILLICIAIYLIVNLLAVNLADYKKEMVNTLNVLSFEEKTEVKDTFSFIFGTNGIKGVPITSKKEEIKYRVVAEKDGRIIEYFLNPKEVQLQKTEKQSKLEIYTAKCTNPILQIFFFLPERTEYRLFLREDFLKPERR